MIQIIRYFKLIYTYSVLIKQQVKKRNKSKKKNSIFIVNKTVTYTKIKEAFAEEI